MGIPGFPSEVDLSSMMGFVTDEDREKWTRMKQASDRALDGARNGLAASGLISQSMASGVGMAEKSVAAQLIGEETRTRHHTQPKQTTRTVTALETEKPVRSEDHEMGY